VGRVHRYPQDKEVVVYRLFARGTVEEELYGAWGLLGGELEGGADPDVCVVEEATGL
jgi:hypothetical protein